MTELKKFSKEHWDQWLTCMAEYHAPLGDPITIDCLFCLAFASCGDCVKDHEETFGDEWAGCGGILDEDLVDQAIERLELSGVFDA